MYFLLLSLWTKSYDVTIQMKPLWQYFCMVPFVFQYFAKWNLRFFLNFDIGTLGSQRVKTLTILDEGACNVMSFV